MNIKFSERNGLKSEIIKGNICRILDILEAIGVPFEGVTDRCKEQMAMACMALSSLRGTFDESMASQPKTTKQIISVWNADYSDTTSTGSYDSVRDGALKRLLDNGIIIKESGVKNSSTAGYYVSQEFIDLIKSFEKDDWEQKLEIFKSQITIATTKTGSVTDKECLNMPLQQIFYGAPGTGKSHKTNEVAKKYSTIRTTFHPDSDYSTFVGAYKPKTVTEERYGLNGSNTVALTYPEGERSGKPIKDRKIEYRFVKQAFMKAYVKAWKLFVSAENPDEAEPQFLVIEEINRGNCTQIFGDLFQLLDRKDGFSEYPIEADDDIRNSLLCEDSKADPSFGEEGLQLTDKQRETINNVFNDVDSPFHDVASEIACGQVLVLPSNLYIWATMNTSDQSLFPIDSAFKRRWDWKYLKIKEGKDKNGNKLDWTIDISQKDENGKEKPVSWWAFIQKINEIIASMTSSADKQLGYFFCKADKKQNETDSEATVISADAFVGKVLFYLWNDVFKDYGFEDASLFRYKSKEEDEEKETEKDLTFPDFYDKNGEQVNTVRVTDFVGKVMNWKKNNEENG